LRAIADNDFGARTSIEQVMRMMVPFLAADMRADSGVADPSLAQALPIARRNALAMPAKG
ncbi:MAG TPA: TetR family transcriptional regulator, partial [Pseudomonas sp.]|nr:TetR family transcriptional regulator [Pseudomonas sp.]